MILAKYSNKIQNLGMYFMSSVIVALIGVILNPLYAMYLSPEDYAVIGYYSSFNLLLVPLLNFCLYSFYSRYYFFTTPDRVEDLENTVLLSSLIIGFISLTLFTVVFYIVHGISDCNFDFWPYAILSFVQLYIANISSLYLTKLRITRDAKKYAVFAIGQSLLIAIFSVTLVVYFEYGATGKLLGTLIGSIVASVYAFMRMLTKARLDMGILKESLRFCTPLVISALFWYGLTGIDRLFLEDLNDTYTYGLYSVGLQISGYLTIFYTSISNTFEPDIYQSIAEGNRHKLVESIVAIIGITVIANIAFIILAPWVVQLLTANRYVEATHYAQILAVHNIAMACYYMVIRLYVGYGYVKQELLVRIVGTLISIAMFYLLIEHYGFVGAAWGQVLSFSIMTVLGIVCLVVLRSKLNGLPLK